MSRHAPTMTADQLWAMPDDGKRYELVEGELRMMSPAGGRHGRVALKLAQRLANYVEQHSLGIVFAAETGFVLRRNPDTVRAPDVAFVSKDKLGDFADYPGFLPLAPDLVAEVISPSDTAAEVEDKVLSWLKAGVAVVLVVDPQTKTIHDDRSKDDSRVYSAGFIDLDDVVPGYRLDVADVFA